MSGVATYVTAEGHEVVVRSRFPKAGLNTFVALVDGVEEFAGTWDELTLYAQSRDWKHVSTATAQKRLDAASTRNKSRGLMSACAPSNSENSFGL